MVALHPHRPALLQTTLPARYDADMGGAALAGMPSRFLM